jgi:hypothetical protein
MVVPSLIEMAGVHVMYPFAFSLPLAISSPIGFWSLNFWTQLEQVCLSWAPFYSVISWSCWLGFQTLSRLWGEGSTWPGRVKRKEFGSRVNLNLAKKHLTLAPSPNIWRSLTLSLARYKVPGPVFQAQKWRCLC